MNTDTYRRKFFEEYPQNIKKSGYRVFINSDLMNIVRTLCKFSVSEEKLNASGYSAFINNVLKEHFEMHKEEIKGIVKEHEAWMNQTFGKL